jgi:hypothetical protein
MGVSPLGTFRTGDAIEYTGNYRRHQNADQDGPNQVQLHVHYGRIPTLYPCPSDVEVDSRGHESPGPTLQRPLHLRTLSQGVSMTPGGSSLSMYSSAILSSFW